MFAGFLHCKVTLSSTFPYCTLWREVPMHNPHLRSRELDSPSLRTEYLHKLFEILLCGQFVYSSPFIYLFKHLFRWTEYGLRDTYFILWVIIQYNIISFLFFFKNYLFIYWLLGLCCRAQASQSSGHRFSSCGAQA